MFSVSPNPPNPFHATTVEWFEMPRPQRLRLREDDAAEILRMVSSPDIPFRWSANPYRGCTHACAYCYARRTHEYLDLGAGEDFERIVLYKPRAAELLQRAFDRPSWKGEQINFSGVTDCYQPVERRLGLMRQCLEVAVRYRNPVSIVTRSPLVVRDTDLLGELAALGACRVQISIPVLEPDVVRALEPGTAPPSARFRAIAALAEAGIPVGVSVAPVIPGLTDRTMPEVLERAREAGASWAWMSLLRLPGSVRQVFEDRLRERLPLRAEAVLTLLGRARAGQSRPSDFCERMRGRGPEWDLTTRMFETWRDRLGFGQPPLPPDRSPFIRGGQLALF